MTAGPLHALATGGLCVVAPLAIAVAGAFGARLARRFLP